MDTGTFFKLCVYITFCLLIFTLSVNFVSASGFFPVTVEAGPEIGDSANETFLNLVGGDFTTTDMWIVVLTGTGAIGILVAWLTRSTAILGVYLFSVIFWASYLNMISVTNLLNYVPLGFLAIGTTGMIFIYVGAVIGMLSGSG